MKKYLSLLIVLCLLLVFAGCSAASVMDSANGFAGGYTADMESADAYYRAETSLSKPETGSAMELPEGRKWIITVNMEAETEDLDGLLSAINAKISEMNGYVESQHIYNGSTYSNYRYRNASITIRVPAELVESFTDEVKGLSNVVSSNRQLEDVTTTYVDTESRLKALEVEQERLLSLLEQAESMADLLEIESRLTDVRYELENAASQLRVYDNLIDYATINLSIEEVQEYTPVEEKTLWQRIGDGFMGSLKSLGNAAVEVFAWLVINLPYLILLAGAIAAIVFLCRRAKKRRAKKYPPRSTYYAPPQSPVPPAPPMNNPENKPE